MTEPMIAAHDLHCRYGAFPALRGLDLAVRRGELVALFGVNGAGKTTALDVLRGLRRPAGGSARVLGLDPARRRRALAPRVGVVPQESGFAGGLSVAETYRLWTALRGVPPEPALLDEVGLADKRRVRVRQLSGGERRRLDLAVALTGAPGALLLDEPTTGLDPGSRERAWALIRARRSAGAAVLLSSHHTEEAEALADRVAVLAAGRLVAAGTPEQVTAGRPYRIRWVTAGRRRDLPALAGTSAWRDLPERRAELTVTTADPDADLAALRTMGVGGRLTVTPPSVADVLRDLAGAA